MPHPGTPHQVLEVDSALFSPLLTWMDLKSTQSPFTIHLRQELE
jgi:hypothetical protein